MFIHLARRSNSEASTSPLELMLCSSLVHRGRTCKETERLRQTATTGDALHEIRQANEVKEWRPFRSKPVSFFFLAKLSEKCGFRALIEHVAVDRDRKSRF